MRNSVSWSRDNVSASLMINYVDSYRNNRLGQEADIESLTTADLTFRYNTGELYGDWLNNTVLSVNVLNLLNQDPPFVANSTGLNFDATNASALGRFISIGLSKQW